MGFGAAMSHSLRPAALFGVRLLALWAAGGCARSPCSGVKGTCVELVVAPALTVDRLALTISAPGVSQPRYDVGGDGRTLSLPTTIPLVFDALAQPTDVKLAVDALRAGGHVASGGTEFSLSPMEHKRESVTLMLDAAGSMGGDGVDGGNDGTDGAPPGGATDGGGGACPSGMVFISAPTNFCIDATEVTAADYRKFMAVPVGDLTIPPKCAGQTSFAPQFYCNSQFNMPDQQYPVMCVNWCDATAYCAWAGKHLCGAIGSGGPLEPNDIFDPMKSEWMYACTHGGTSTFPYGPVFNRDACNGSEHNMKTGLPGGSMPSCEGGYHGLFDMVGNRTEFINISSAPEKPASMGGSYHSATMAGCNVPDVVYEDDGTNSFRCCK